VDSRAVLLLDIVEFSLFTPFEQASQLNSLSYSLNSAYNKLLGRGIEVNFARTTTGDGYYVWNRDLGPDANRDLFYFMLLVVADNAVARAASQGNTVPVVRTAYHIGSHYELYQAEGVNPTVFSYIVGDVTIDLARMVDLAGADQILVGDFQCESGGSQLPGPALATPAFIRGCNRGLSAVQGIQLSGKTIDALSCRLTESIEPDGKTSPRRFRIVDKHGLSRHAYNLQLEIDLAGRDLFLGLGGDQLFFHASPASADSAPLQPPAARPAASAQEVIDDLANMLKKRSAGTITED
jgi:hypothetical protein